jgi:hypothetical protein
MKFKFLIRSGGWAEEMGRVGCCHVSSMSHVVGPWWGALEMFNANPLNEPVKTQMACPLPRAPVLMLLDFR